MPQPFGKLAVLQRREDRTIVKVDRANGHQRGARVSVIDPDLQRQQRCEDQPCAAECQVPNRRTRTNQHGRSDIAPASYATSFYNCTRRHRS